MKQPPQRIGGAKVVRWSAIDGRHRPTGMCRHVTGGVLQEPAAALAICQHDAERAFYLFGCDAEWNVVTDSWHATLEEALEQAEFEYGGVSESWNVA